MKTARILAFLAVTVLCAVIGIQHGILPAVALWCATTVALSAPVFSARLCVTLTATEILMDVIKAFAIRLPRFSGLGVEFSPTSLKLDKNYIGHISTIPTVRDYDASTGYLANAASARDHLVDVPVTVSRHRHVPLKWPYLNMIADDKQKYDEVIRNAGFALARNFALDIAAEFKSRNFSQTSTFAAADCDVDMLVDVAGDMNLVGAMTEGRTMWMNTLAANALSLDSRMASKDYQGQITGGSSRRRWVNAFGFAAIEEWPELGTNNGTALTSVTAEADDDLFTKTAHGLVTGDRVVLTAMTSVVGVTVGSTYYVIKVSADTFKLASTAALAAAGTALDITTDGTSGTITPTENLAAFAFSGEAMAILAGPPEPGDDALMAALGIPRVMGWTEPVTEPDSGITMAAVSWQAVGTGDLYWSPVMLWGKALGRQAGSSAAGQICDYAGHRIITA